VAGEEVSEPLPPAYIKLQRQNGQNPDCAVASMGMLFGVNYEEALAACLGANPDVLEEGMTWAQMREAADLLGGSVKLLPRGRYDIEEATGLLNVKNGVEDHAVLLWAGRIVEGNGELWLEPDDYLAHYKYQPYSLLVRIA
jgi:hypothetical protein